MSWVTIAADERTWEGIVRCSTFCARNGQGGNMPVSIKGKMYSTVAERTAAWHRSFANSKITTSVEFLPGGECVAKAIGIPDLDNPERTFTGHACERQQDSRIHERNHIEIAETSAVGRMLGFAGFLSDGSIATADEVTREMAHEKQEALDHIRSKPTQPPAEDTVQENAAKQLAYHSHSTGDIDDENSDVRLRPAHNRIDEIEDLGELLGAADKILAGVEVERYTRETGQKLLLHLYARCVKVASASKDFKQIAKNVDDLKVPLSTCLGEAHYDTLRNLSLRVWDQAQKDEQELLPPS